MRHELVWQLLEEGRAESDLGVSFVSVFCVASGLVGVRVTGLEIGRTCLGLDILLRSSPRFQPGRRIVHRAAVGGLELFPPRSRHLATSQRGDLLPDILEHRPFRRLRHLIQLVGRFRQMMSLDEGDDPGLDPERPGAVLGDIEALQGVRQYPVRIKCASLGWNTLLEALDA